MATAEQLNAIDRYINEVWGKGDLGVIDEIFTSDRVRHGPDFEGTHPGSEGQKDIVALYRTSTPDLAVSVEAQVGKGDLVVTRWSGTGTNLGPTMGVPPTGRSGEVWGFFMHRFGRRQDRRSMGRFRHPGAPGTDGRVLVVTGPNAPVSRTSTGSGRHPPVGQRGWIHDMATRRAGRSEMTGRRFILVVVGALVAGGFVTPTMRVGVPVAEAGIAAPENRLALHFRGTGNLEPAEPGRFQWATDVYSLVTGEKLGTGTNNADLRVPIEDHVITFHLPDGDLVAHSKQSVMPDPQHPGFAVVGIHQDNNIVPEKGTGAYAGRTGKATMSGWVDGRKLPAQATFNNFYLVELDPES